METRLTTPSQKIVLAGCVFFSLLYCVLISLRYSAECLAGKTEARSLQLAARLQPWNADHRFRLGEYYASVQSWPEASTFFAEAARLNPNKARYWLSLATAESVLNRDTYSFALQRARLADPTQPEVAWQASQIYFANGNIPEGLKNLRTVLATSSVLTPGAVQLVWQVKPDVDALLRDTIPPNAEVYSSLLDFLLSRRDTPASAKVWQAMVKIATPVRRSRVLDYVKYLIAQREPGQARSVWEQAANLSDLKSYQATPENLIVNGNFTFDILNGGFDWTYQTRPDVALALDPTETFSGSRSMLISYDSRGLEDTGLWQLVPVEPNTAYKFSADFKVQNMEGAGGTYFVVRDLYTSKPYFASNELKDAAAWKQVSGEFTTGPEATVIVVAINREPAGSPIKGKLWINSVRINKK